MRRDELRDMLLSLLYTEYLDRGKEIWFKSRILGEDIEISSKSIGHTCGELQGDGFVCRHGCKNRSAWGTCFNTFSHPL